MDRERLFALRERRVREVSEMIRARDKLIRRKGGPSLAATRLGERIDALDREVQEIEAELRSS